MKKTKYLVPLLVLALLLSGCLMWPWRETADPPANNPPGNDSGGDSQDPGPPPPPGKVLAFPEAEGFGAEASGGRGGKVYIVTNLNDSGPGSLRAAIEASGPRIVVFRVSGVIELKSTLQIRNGNITIAGQTSPQGITLTNFPFEIRAENVIVRHIRIRMGDAKIPKEKADSADAVLIRDAKNVILDHVTASWGIDETLSIVDSDLVTVQWSIVSEALNRSLHSKGDHGYGSLIRGAYGDRVTIHHNLYAHNRGRNPRPGNYTSYKQDPTGLLVDFRNNVVYNWGGGSAGNNEDSDTITKYNFVGNYYKRGPNSSSSSVAFKDNAPYAQAYWEGNAMNGSVPSNQWSLVSGDGPKKSTYVKHDMEIPAAYVETHTAHEAYTLVLADAGAFPRDFIDARVVDSVQKGSGKIIDRQTEAVNSWPQTQPPTTGTVVDPNWKDANNNGIPDWWEAEHGVINGNHNQIMPSGYTAVEEYINWVAAELLKQ